MSGHDDFECEPEPGLPERLPPGERVIWRGSPEWRSLARHAFHVRKVAVYFALLGAWFLIEAVYDGAAVAETVSSLVSLGAVAALALGLLAGLAWLSARETIYTLTDRRLVLRFGIALRLTLNVPYRMVDHAGLKDHGDGTGDLPLALGGSDRVSYLVLWPHARPWHLRHPQIMLRSVPQPERVAALLGAALARRAPDSRRQEHGSFDGAVAAS